MAFFSSCLSLLRQRHEHLSELREQADGTFAQRGDNRTYVPGSTDAAPWPESLTLEYLAMSLLHLRLFSSL